MSKRAEPNKVNVKMIYSFLVTADEFRVLMAALRSVGSGVPFKPEFRGPAMILQDKLFKARNASAKLQLENILEHHKSEAQAAHDFEAGPPPPEIMKGRKQ